MSVSGPGIPQPSSLRQFLRRVARVRGQWFGHGQFAVLLTHWFYFSNHRYVGERAYFVRVGQRRRNFGPVKRV